LEPLEEISLKEDSINTRNLQVRWKVPSLELQGRGVSERVQITNKKKHQRKFEGE